MIGLTLEKALNIACEALKVPMPRASYFDFRYPQANNMLILLNVLPTPGAKNMYIKLPSTYTLYHVAYYVYGCNLGWRTSYARRWYSLKIDFNGAQMLKMDGNGDTGISRQVKEFPIVDFGLNKLHEIKLEYTQEKGDNGSAGLAWVLIFRAP